MSGEKDFDPNSYLQSLKKTANTTLEIDMRDPLAFGRMFFFSDSMQTQTQRVNLMYDGKCVGYLAPRQPTGHEFFEPNFPYCYSADDEYLSWEQFGDELSKYDDETIKLIAKIALRYMRIDSRVNNSDPEKDRIEMTVLLKKLSIVEQQGNYPPMELLAQLVGAAACESGRGHTGYINVFATLTRIKLHQNFTETPLSDFIKKELLPSDYKNTNMKSIKHATAFPGSQNIIRTESGQEELHLYSEKNEKKVQYNNKWVARSYANAQHKQWHVWYQKRTSDDMTTLVSDQSMGKSGQEKHKDEKHKDRAHRKLGRHITTTKGLSSKLGIPGNKSTGQKGSSSTTDKKHKISTIKDAFKKPMSKSSNNWLYTDVDISTYVNTFINNNGGHKEKCDYILANGIKIDDSTYIVAVTPPVRTVAGDELNTPINYFFDKSNFAYSSIADFLEKISKTEEMYKKIDKYYDEIIKAGREQGDIAGCYDDLAAYLMGKFDITSETATTMIDHLNNHFLGEVDLDGIIENIKKEKEGHDVLHEILPEMDKQLGETKKANAKIIFPYNLNDAHWVTAEVNISAVVTEEGKHHYQVDVFTHNPYGGGKMSKEEANMLYKTIVQRVKEYYSDKEDIEVTFKGTNHESPYKKPRQHNDDGISCGVITARDMAFLLRGENPDVEAPFPNQAVELRTEQLKYVQENGDKKNCQSFITKNQKVLGSSSNKEETPNIDMKDVKEKDDISLEGSDNEAMNIEPKSKKPKTKGEESVSSSEEIGEDDLETLEEILNEYRKCDINIGKGNWPTSSYLDDFLAKFTIGQDILKRLPEDMQVTINGQQQSVAELRDTLTVMADDVSKLYPKNYMSHK